MTIYTVQTSEIQLVNINDAKELADNNISVQCFASKKKAFGYLKQTLQNIVSDLKDRKEDLNNPQITISVLSENPKHCYKTKTSIDNVSTPSWMDMDEYNVSTADGMNLWVGQINRFVISELGTYILS